MTAQTSRGACQGRAEPRRRDARLWALKLRTTIVVTVAIALLASACVVFSGNGATPGASRSPGAGGAPGDSVYGRTFLSTAIEGRTLVVGSRVRLAFRGGSISANAGCNTMGGAYTIKAGRLVVRQLMTTEMGCDPQLMAQDRWLADLVDGAAIALAGDTLTLEKSGIRVTLVDRRVADPDRPLSGTRWIVDGLITGETASSIPAGITAALTIANGRAAVETGCNSGGGTVKVTAKTLTFGPLALSKKACGPDAAAIERAVTAALQGTVTYSIEAGVLSLRAARAGGAGLTLRAVP